MPDTTTTDPVVVVEPTLEDFTYFEVENGLLCFIGLEKDICQKVEALGFQIYYLMTWEKYYEKVGTTDKLAITPSYRPQFFKVVNNMVGRIVAPTTEIALDSVEQQCKFTLPKIPLELIDHLDAFFRKVDEKQHTESIVLLTYDTAYEGSDGWGFLIPTQKNTATFCDYEPDSVVDEQPDTAYIVGSAHSHPNMSAYASGTDHNDQADFDGIHITYGWQKHVKGGQTQHYIEQQMQGMSVVLSPEVVFEPHPKIEHDADEIDKWIEDKVTKKTTTVHVVGKGNSGTSGGFGTSSSAYSGGVYSSKPAERQRIKAYPKTAPDLEKNIIVGIIAPEESTCPFCEGRLIKPDFEKRRCMNCHQYFAYDGEGITDIVAIRTQNDVYTHDINITDETVTKKIYFWIREKDNDKFALVYDPDAGKA